MRTPFDFLWAVSTKKSYWVFLLWSDSQGVYFVRPSTLLLCIFLFWFFLLYHTDPQVEVQIKILLKETAIVSKMQTPAITLWFPEHRFKENFYLGFFINLLLHIPLLAFTNGQTEWLTEEQIHLLCMGWMNFFSSCAVVSVFWFLAGNRFWCYLLTYLEYNTVVVLC
jgi:hypothetical protein